MAGCWSARRRRRAGAPSGSSSCPDSPSASSRSGCARTRCCSTPAALELDAPLAVADTRADDERLQLRLAVGAAAERIHLSYPRLELAESRPRVPSFYVLDVLRATTGRIPRYKALSDLAFENGRASLDWPAPPSPEDAIDDLEHDLAVLRPLLREPASERSRANGRARYLLELNPSLLRSMRERYARWQQGIAPGRRPQPRRRPDPPGARPGAAHRAAVLADRAAALRRSARTSSSSPPSTGWRRSKSRRRCSASIR